MLNEFCQGLDGVDELTLEYDIRRSRKYNYNDELYLTVLQSITLKRTEHGLMQTYKKSLNYEHVFFFQEKYLYGLHDGVGNTFYLFCPHLILKQRVTRKQLRQVKSVPNIEQEFHHVVFSDKSLMWIPHHDGGISLWNIVGKERFQLVLPSSCRSRNQRDGIKCIGHFTVVTLCSYCH